MIVIINLSDEIIARIFQILCLYTSIHILALFAYQIDLPWDTKLNTSMAKFVSKTKNKLMLTVSNNKTMFFRHLGLVYYHNFQYNITEGLLENQGHHYFLPILLIIQHFALWTYSDMVCKTLLWVAYTSINKKFF